MKHTEVAVLAASLILVASHASAQGMEFTLDEVEAPAPPPKGKGKGKPEEPSVDTKQAISDALGKVRWGMSKADLLKLLRAEVRAEFEQRVKVERDIMRQDQLYQQAQEQYRRLNDNIVEFDGKKSGWDVSPIGGEFTHGNRESMLVLMSKDSRDMYFFIQGKLWKWYRELAPAALNVEDANDALNVLTSRFGSGKNQTERQNDAKVAYEGKVWSDGSTRVTAMRRGSDTCLILEDVHTIEQLAVLRHNVQPMAGKSSSATIDSILLSDAELKARQ